MKIFPGDDDIDVISSERAVTVVREWDDLNDCISCSLPFPHASHSGGYWGFGTRKRLCEGQFPVESN